MELFSELETFVITDISRRLKKVGEMSSSAEFQSQQAKLYGIKNIEAKIAATLNLSYEQIESLFPQIMSASLMAESEIYKRAKLNTIDYKSKPIQDYIKAAIKQTKGDIENITQSLGFAEVQNGKIVYSDIAKFYQKELNQANLKIVTGVQDYNSAIKQAVKKISQSGLRTITKPTVEYPSGWSNQLDVATRRAVLTGTHQMNQEMTNHFMDELVPSDEQYAETTAHANCRPSHQNWQGRVFKVNGSNKDYENLAEATDLGGVTGLMGANCRHSYFTFVLGASVRTYTDEQLKNINTPDFEYKGKTYTGYEATQYQRKIETSMRQVKRSLICYNETDFKDEFRIESVKLQALKNEYRQFSDAMGARQKLERANVEGFNKSISQKQCKQVNKR